MENIKYAVVTTYSFDPDVPVALFDSEEAAMAHMREQWEKEKRIDIEENGWTTEANFFEEEGRAEVKNTFPRPDGSVDTNVTTWTITSNIREMREADPVGKSKVMYRMRLVFSVDVSKPELNKLLAACGQPHPIFPGVIESTITQTIDRVPTKKMLSSYADALAKAYESEECHVEKVKFLRYDFILPVEDSDNT